MLLTTKAPDGRTYPPPDHQAKRPQALEYDPEAMARALMAAHERNPIQELLVGLAADVKALAVGQERQTAALERLAAAVETAKAGS